MNRLLGFLVIMVAICVAAIAAPATEAEQRARRETFRTFAELFVGEWQCEIKEYNGKDAEPVWSDSQRRMFEMTMSHHFMQERAILKTTDGRDYEPGLHLTTFDPHFDLVVQHGFWLPLQPDPLFRIEGRIDGKEYSGKMRIREESGAFDVRPFAIRWLDGDTWAIEVTDTLPDGTVFLRERLTYTRRAPTPGP